MFQNSFLQKVFLTIFWGLCAAGLVEFYIHIVWRANEDINGKAAVEAASSDSRQRAHPSSRGSSPH